MRRALLILFLVFSTLTMMSQQLPQLSLRMIDDLVFNPAVVGVKENKEILLSHRSQWVGFSNAPITQVLSYNGSLKENMGLGGFLVNDITGPTRRFSLNIAYAYHVSFDNLKLSLGLTGTLMQYGIDGKKVTINDQSDNAIQENISDRSWKPDASFGAYLSNEKFFVGLSVQQLFNSRAKIHNDDFEADIPMISHFYLTSGYNFKMNEDIVLSPSLLVSTTFGSPTQIDFNVKVDYQKKVFGGLSYRYSDAVVILAGINIKKMFVIAYTFDIVTSELRRHNSGSHEFVLSFLFPSKKEEATMYEGE